PGTNRKAPKSGWHLPKPLFLNCGVQRRSDRREQDRLVLVRSRDFLISRRLGLILFPIGLRSYRLRLAAPADGW
ncbi:MAG: hypothetical protein EA381_18975, partial [Planctomycetaceae bacterium]